MLNERPFRAVYTYSMPSPAIVLARSELPPSQVEPPPPAARSVIPAGFALDQDVRALGAVLETARRSGATEDLRTSQKVAHELMMRAEQRAFTEVANAVFHIEDALTAMADGELEANEATWRQIDAAYRAAHAACELEADPTPSTEVALPQGRILLVIRDERLAEDISRAASRRKFSVAIAGSAAEACAMAMGDSFNGLVIDFDDASPSECRALALSLRELLSSKHCPLVALAEAPSYATRLCAAESRAALVLQKPIAGDKLMAALESLDVREKPEQPRLLFFSENEPEGKRLEALLAPHGITINTFSEREQIVEALDATQPAALLVDRNEEHAALVCRLVRAIPRWRDLPILIRVHGEQAKLSAYDAGADDALSEAASDRELVGRLRVRLERTRVFREQSNRDPLTGLLTRRAFSESMHARLAEAERAKRHLSVCFLDLDRFKSINDNYGHATGDKVLAGFGALLGARFRLPDLRGRWGGEEFVVAFYGEWAESAREILSRVTAEFSNMVFDAGSHGSFRVTVSGGIATFPVDGQTLDDLVSVADQRLYAAKLAGRNRIRI
jgi:diguanylate cyclase (GGDEF)-like protein